MPAHTHDGVDWAARLTDLRQADAANAAALRSVADRLIESVPAPHPTVIDVGSGAGGMSAALAAALVGRASGYPAIPKDTTPVTGERPATPRQPPTVAETGQSPATPATDHPAETAPAPADAPLATNPNPPSGDRSAGTVATTGHSIAPASKPATDTPAHHTRAAAGTFAATAGDPGPVSDRAKDIPVDDSHPAAPASVVAAGDRGPVSDRAKDIPVHDSHPASARAHPVPASGRAIGTSVQDRGPAGAVSAVADASAVPGRPADTSAQDSRAAVAMSVAADVGAVSGCSADISIHDGRSAVAASAIVRPAPVSGRPIGASVQDSGPAAPAQMAARTAGATLVLVDMVPELLAAAEEAALAAIDGSGAVDVRTVRADVADPASFVGLPSADLVWASNVVHHLPDQRAAVLMLAGLLAPGGCLALSEGRLSMRCLPWDVGVGEPGLQDRLIAAHGTWFHRMRAEMPDAVRLPVGWNQVLREAGLSGVTAFSYLVDVPAPLSDDGRGAVVSWLSWMSHAAADLLDPADMAALERLLDPDDPAYVGRRDDVFMLKASTVYLGWR